MGKYNFLNLAWGFSMKRHFGCLGHKHSIDMRVCDPNTQNDVS